ncbi:DMATS type aromatic prenyltransferase [Saccharothrix tamanrassetensis]|uniref:DMATS type aromatic prenyltransferase n=1 Tax=Saccharothrix tamanrassetensis TaxID=1051531 RepID=A0A841CBD8_9PSEU|nr:tryptophan dimethylallyltransferase family protein [Saccharothrix tamanrassetensis]MBB5954263.1 DMATS type aromatic prenyltransferase [Saccharothrix tamanrassetensis]
MAQASRREGLFSASDSTYRGFAFDKWLAIGTALGFSVEQLRVSLGELGAVLGDWSDRRIGLRREYPSFVSRDGFPIEFSVSWRGGVPEVRVLFESIGAQPTARAAQDAGRALTRSLAGRPGVSLTRYHLVEDLFVVDEPRPFRPTVWHSLAYRPGEKPRYKVYLNPQAHGPAAVPEVMCAAMTRLGLPFAWDRVAAQYHELADEGHQLEFVALDLADTPDARVKVYFRHTGRVDLDRVASLARTHDPVSAGPAYRDVYGSPASPDNEPMTCLAFRSGCAGPEEANVYLRLPGAAESDADAAARITSVMRRFGVDHRQYRHVAEALAPLPLESMAGMHELLSFRTASRRPDLGVYFRFAVYDTPVDGVHV